MNMNFYRNTVSILLLTVSLAAFSQQDYFQQHVAYKLKAKLDDQNHFIHANEKLSYTNNSQDTLHEIYFHLWPNAYKNIHTDFAKQQIANNDDKFLYSPANKKGYIDSLDFEVANKKVELIFDSEHIDIAKIILNEPLLPNQKIEISTPFRVKLPGDFSRLGHVGQSYQITQWYPKPAVYDKDGWHAFPYLDLGEFYSEYGSFEVEITLPKNYVVGATGELQNKDELAWLDKKALETSKQESFDRRDMAFPESSEHTKTLTYKQDQIHDFAWFADKRYNVLKDSVQLPNSGRWVTTYTMFFNNQSNLWNNSQEYIKDALYKYSKWYGDYPYDYCSAVQGAISAGGAMEYPMITVVGSSSTKSMLELMIMHEVGHNWFYGILGFNERRYPFMDEGINSFSEYRYMHEKYGDDSRLYEMFFSNRKLAELLNMEEYTENSYYTLSTQISMRVNRDQPMDSPSSDFLPFNYAAIVYTKTAISLSYLYEYLGEEKFNEAMQGFYEDWKFKHPGPADFESSFKSVVDEDLSWFFKDIITTTKKYDYKVVKVKDDKVLVKNAGDIASPVEIAGYAKNIQQFKTWDQGFSGKKWIDIPQAQIDQIKLNPFVSPELNQKNNLLKTKGLLKRVEPFQINKFQLLEKPDKTAIGVLPAVGWNAYNGFMAGGLLYSPVLPLQKLEYHILPMFGFKNKRFAGMGDITLHTFPNKLERVDFTLSGRQFGAPEESLQSYNKGRFAIDIFLKNKVARSPLSKKVYLSYTNIGYVSSNSRQEFVDLGFSLKNYRMLNPYKLDVSLENSTDYTRFLVSAKYSISTKYDREAFSFRFFGGSTIPFHDKSNSISLSSGPLADQQMDKLFFERFTGSENSLLFSKQTSVGQGNFMANMPLVSDQLASLQFKAKLYKYPFFVYASVGTFKEAEFYGQNYVITVFPQTPEYNGSNVLWESGLIFSLTKFLDIYLPFYGSAEIEDYLSNTTDNYMQKIRFNLKLDQMNLFKYRDQIVR